MAEQLFPVDARDVHVRVGGHDALKGVNLHLDGRGRIVILGANGAGKSVLLRVLHGLMAPTSGAITWAGSARRPNHQAMVFQRPVMLRRSAMANIEYALAVNGTGNAEAELRAREAIEHVGLTHAASRQARALSGGEQQRIALARAWALQPDVLFLDEPTASLDPAATRAVEAIVRDIHARGTTIVMSTHNLAQAKRLAFDIAFMHRGRIVERTPAADFFRNPASPEAQEFIEGERL